VRRKEREYLVNLVCFHRTIRVKPVKENHELKSLGYEKIFLEFGDEVEPEVGGSYASSFP
jgi:hypothetical protein